MTKNNNIENLTACESKEIDLHIAEYNTLTTRCTYFLNIQNILLTALIAWMVVIGTIWNSKAEYILIWGFLFGCHIIALINVNFSYEQYNMIRYIERELKPKINALVNNEAFWNYEPYLEKERKKNNKWINVFEYSAVVLSLLIIVTIGIYRFRHWVGFDILGLLLNLLLSALLFVKTRQTINIRLSSWN